MLNRLFIVVGVMAIMALLAAYLVPRFYDWNQNREPVELTIGEALGGEARIRGDISFTLLPQPRLVLTDLQLGPLEAPHGEVERVEVDFALMELLRDRFVVTRLLLESPRVLAGIDASGNVNAAIRPPRVVSSNNVLVEEATIAGGSILFSDARSGESWEVTDIAATVRLGGLTGPYTIQAEGIHAGTDYQARVTTTDRNEFGQLGLNGFLRPLDDGFRLTLDGMLETRGTPTFAGDLSFRHAVPADEPNVARGDLVLEGTVQADARRVLLSQFALQTDENQTGSRFSGSAELDLGAQPRFNAVLSGGVVSLIPRDLTQQASAGPYELLRLIRDLPRVPPAPIPGEIHAAISELDLRGIKLGSVVFDAHSAGGEWTISRFAARLAGDTSVDFAGTVGNSENAPAITGRFELNSGRLDAFAQSWRRPPPGNPLFGVPGQLTGTVRMQADRLALAGAQLKLGDAVITGEVATGLADAPALSVSAQLGELDARTSAQLLALLPDPVGDDGSFAASFRRGTLSLLADRVHLAGEDMSGLVLDAEWDETGIAFDRFTIGEVAGAAVNGAGRLEGPLVAPELTGHLGAQMSEDADIDVLLAFAGVNDAPAWLEDVLVRNRPLRLDLTGTPAADGWHRLDVVAKGADLAAEASIELSGGLAGWRNQPIIADLVLDAPDVASLLAGLGMAGGLPVPTVETGARLTAHGEGTVGNSLESQVLLSTGDDRLSFGGSLIVSDLEKIRGRGSLEVRLGSESQLHDLLRTGSYALPDLSGLANLTIPGEPGFALSDIVLNAGGLAVSGNLDVDAAEPVWDVTGELEVDTASVGALGAFLFGPAAMIAGEGTWPIGPVTLAETGTSGRIDMSAPLLVGGGTRLATGLDFTLVWDGTETRIRNLTGAIGEGEITADLRLCCEGVMPEKQLTARFALDGVPLSYLVPANIGSTIDASVLASGQFTGSGTTPEEIMARLGGSGSISLNRLGVAGLNPDVFEIIGAIDNVVELEADELELRVADALADGALRTGNAELLFSVAGGAARAGNVSITTPELRLFGDLALDLDDLDLSGGWQINPASSVGGNGYVTEQTGRIDVAVAGSFLTPEIDLDVTGMVDAIKVLAYEQEVARLEQLRAEAEARAAAAAREERERRERLARAEQALDRARWLLEFWQAHDERVAAEEAARLAAEQAEQERQPFVVDAAPPEGDGPIQLIPDDFFANE